MFLSHCFNSTAFQDETGLIVDRIIAFSPTDLEMSINFTVIDDNIALEPTEYLEWTLSLLTVRDRASISPFNTSNIVIVDDDGMSLLIFKAWSLH